MDNNEVKDETLIGRVHNKDFATLKDDMEAIVAKKIVNRIQQVKSELFTSPTTES